MNLTPNLQLWGTVFFGIAVLHTFSVTVFRKLSHRFRTGSLPQNILEFLGELEIVFGLWATLFLLVIGLSGAAADAQRYLDSRSFIEPVFVFVILVVCSTRGILDLALGVVHGVSRAASRVLPIHPAIALLFVALTVGPLLGSFITEPAAMAVTALILRTDFFERKISSRLKYAILGTLFVNVSIGGTLTPFSAPPVLMVAAPWGWDLRHMLWNFGWKACLAIVLSTVVLILRFRGELRGLVEIKREPKHAITPVWIRVAHLLGLAALVSASHHMASLVGVFLVILGFLHVTREHQDPIRLREGLLVALFLGGLVVLGGAQGWWLSPILATLAPFPLYVGAIGLTAITDNAALTYLGTLVPQFPEAARYALVAGAVTGGGLTVIANAPNPAGYGILRANFGRDGIRAGKLFAAALWPTLIAASCFWI